jgi:hypothetical protein
LRAELDLARWKLGRRAPPPPLYKQRVVRRYARLFHARCLVETGTYLGDMVAAQLPHFDRIYSIELSRELAEAAGRRFAQQKKVTIEWGDSGAVLPSLLRQLDEPCVFWLDGHDSGGITARSALATPIMAELRAILTHSREDHIILIDDARCFDGTGDYPTLPEIRAMLSSYRPRWTFEVKDDVIRLHSPPPVGDG